METKNKNEYANAIVMFPEIIPFLKWNLQSPSEKNCKKSSRVELLFDFSE